MERVPLNKTKPSPIYTTDPHGRFARAKASANSEPSVGETPSQQQHGRRQSVLADLFAPDTNKCGGSLGVDNEKMMSVEAHDKRSEGQESVAQHYERSYARPYGQKRGTTVRQRKLPQTQLEVLGSTAVSFLSFLDMYFFYSVITLDLDSDLLSLAAAFTYLYPRLHLIRSHTECASY